MKKYMTVKEFMEVVPISKPHVYRLITNNEIPHLKFGRKVVIHPDALAIGMPIAGLENNPLKQHAERPQIFSRNSRRR